ncbi:hypothetical protein KDH_17300 [Dictyobacter sp. S3.2.2.5]|uniref:DoxX family protein n=2 Tax=Dictyobacter halimunensis TaxID=3026934 RepID=A0ABQ6FM83_9CHLR|nr:hypothetical protein KDH_16810 [Dictyobacter sp. S3.2.2.5]GLV54883.1 hypothetical protein KDH_17300 [Dictyobacter sp. S3.2.2.5]
MRTNVMGSWKAICYWVATFITVLELLAGGVADLTHGKAALVASEPVTEVLAHLGYPVYLLTLLGVWKLLGAIALLVPRFPRLKEWTYAGALFDYTGAIVSSLMVGDSLASTLPPLMLAIFALASWALRPQSRMLGVLWPENRPRRASVSSPQPTMR